MNSIGKIHKYISTFVGKCTEYGLDRQETAEKWVTEEVQADFLRTCPFIVKPDTVKWAVYAIMTVMPDENYGKVTDHDYNKACDGLSTSLSCVSRTVWRLSSTK